MPSTRSSIVLLRRVLRTATPRPWLFSSLLGRLVSIGYRISLAIQAGVPTARLGFCSLMIRSYAHHLIGGGLGLPALSRRLHS
jgi:hypothetical protein